MQERRDAASVQNWERNLTSRVATRVAARLGVEPTPPEGIGGGLAASRRAGLEISCHAAAGRIMQERRDAAPSDQVGLREVRRSSVWVRPSCVRGGRTASDSAVLCRLSCAYVGPFVWPPAAPWPRPAQFSRPAAGQRRIEGSTVGRSREKALAEGWPQDGRLACKSHGTSRSDTRKIDADDRPRPKTCRLNCLFLWISKPAETARQFGKVLVATDRGPPAPTRFHVGGYMPRNCRYVEQV